MKEKNHPPTCFRLTLKPSWVALSSALTVKLSGSSLSLIWDSFSRDSSFVLIKDSTWCSVAPLLWKALRDPGKTDYNPPLIQIITSTTSGTAWETTACASGTPTIALLWTRKSFLPNPVQLGLLLSLPPSFLPFRSLTHPLQASPKCCPLHRAAQPRSWCFKQSQVRPPLSEHSTNSQLNHQQISSVISSSLMATRFLLQQERKQLQPNDRIIWVNSSTDCINTKWSLT